MNLEEVINDPRLDGIIDKDTIPDKSDPSYDFFVNTVELLLEEDENKVKEETNANYSSLVKYESISLATTPAVFSFHEALHAFAAEIVGANVSGFSFDSWGVYTEISGTHAQAAFTSIFPHIAVFPIAFYYTFSRKKLYLVPFMAPTLSEFFPYEIFGKSGDLLITASYLSQDYAVPVKYMLLGAIVGGSYLFYKVINKFKNRNH